MKNLLAADVPVILLMTYAPDGSGGGHYRVAIGYDDARHLIYFVDPWGRDLKYLPGTEGWIAWTDAEVTTAWDYAEYGTPQPFFGAAILPWSVNLSAKGKVQIGATVTVTAQVTYPCPVPFSAADYPAADSTATIEVPAGMTLLGSATRALGTLAAGGRATVTWKVRIDAPPAGPITVQAGGVVSGSVPEARWTGQSQSYPAYNYSDLIGGEAELSL